MRRILLLSAVFLLPLYYALLAAGQNSGTARQDTSEPLKAAYDQAMHAKDWQAALAAAQKLVDLKPMAENLRLLGNAQANSGALQDALATYDRAISVAQQEKPTEGLPDSTWKDEKSKILVAKGNAYLRLKQNSDAIAAYTQAAPLAANPSVAYWNICATVYNTGEMKGAIAPCRQAVQSDPTNVNAWFVFGTVLFTTSPTDDKMNFLITDETRQALNKYLELAPDGPHADDVKAMLKMAK